MACARTFGVEETRRGVAQDLRRKLVKNDAAFPVGNAAEERERERKKWESENEGGEIGSAR